MIVMLMYVLLYIIAGFIALGTIVKSRCKHEVDGCHMGVVLLWPGCLVIAGCFAFSFLINKFVEWVDGD